jgi:predicted Holliday junction resolvase-like endonuclease
VGCQKCWYFIFFIRTFFLPLQKISGMHTIEWKDKALEWKRKTVAQTHKNKALRKRIKEITKSRDEWKRKSLFHKARADQYESDLKKTKDVLQKIIIN